MQRQRIRSSDRTSLAPLLILGLSLGIAAGFLLGELYGGNAKGTLKRALTPFRRLSDGAKSMTDVTDDLQRALEKALGPDSQSLELVRVGKRALELHGWVTSRAARSKALRAARAAIASEIRLSDCLLVWGEDDVPAGEPHQPDESETA
jgi:hypothetical protein